MKTRRVLIINGGADTGGGGTKIKVAFDKFAPGWEVRAVRRADNYIRYPSDITWRASDQLPAEVSDLFRQADLVHLTHNEKLSRFFAGYDAKPKVLHFRGRGNEARIDAAEARGIKVLVSTPNLLRGKAEWVPNIGDAAALAALRKAEHQSGRLPRLVHAPTIRRLKGTDVLMEALRPLADRLDVDLIEGLPLAECLRRKAQGDLLFDQFGLGGAYGSNAIEAWGLGMPVVNQEPTAGMAEHYRVLVGYLPFVPATPETVAGVVAGLLDDPAAMAEATERGAQCFADIHEESKVVERLVRVYEEVLG